MLGDGNDKRIVHMAHFATTESLSAGLSLFTQVPRRGDLRSEEFSEVRRFYVLSFILLNRKAERRGGAQTRRLLELLNTPSAALRTACDLFSITLAGLLVIEEHQEAQAFTLPFYSATDVMVTLAREPGSFFLHQRHVKHSTHTGLLVCASGED
jgi:hypothetical protein